MYFLLSSAVSICLQPLSWLLALLLALAFCRQEKWRKRSLFAALIVALVFTNPWLHHAVSVAWEPEPVAFEEIEDPYDNAIVLGGFTRLYATPTDRLHLSGDANRFTHALELFHAGKVKRLIFVSGGKTSSEPVMSEAELAARTATRFGIPSEAVVALGTSRNTYENAEEYRAFIDKETTNPQRPLLVTSAFHARRSDACFRKAGIEADIFPTDHRSERDHPGRKLTVSNTIVPSPGTMLAWGGLFREWFGLLVYRLRGWI